MSSFKSNVLRTVIHSVPSILTVFAKFQLTFKKIRNCLNVLWLKKIVYICNIYLNLKFSDGNGPNLCRVKNRVKNLLNI